MTDKTELDLFIYITREEARSFLKSNARLWMIPRNRKNPTNEQLEQDPRDRQE